MLEKRSLHEVAKSLKEQNTTLEHHVPEGGESLGDVSERMVNFFKTLCQSVYDKNKLAAGTGAGADSSGTSTSDVAGAGDRSLALSATSLDAEDCSLPKESDGTSDPIAANVCETVLVVRWTLLLL